MDRTREHSGADPSEGVSGGSTGPKFYTPRGAVDFYASRGIVVSVRTLEAHRLRGSGPKFHRLGSSPRGRVYHLEEDLLAWIQRADAGVPA